MKVRLLILGLASAALLAVAGPAAANDVYASGHANDVMGVHVASSSWTGFHPGSSSWTGFHPGSSTWNSLHAKSASWSGFHPLGEKWGNGFRI
jgi:hypothetical protein